MINQDDGSKKKKAAKVGLFGDYIDGADAMLVYDVDSEAEENGLLVRKQSLRKNKKLKSSKSQGSSSSQIQKSLSNDSTPLEKNIVVPAGNIKAAEESK